MPETRFPNDEGSLLREADIVNDTVQAHALGEILRRLPLSSVMAQAASETASPQAVTTVLRQNPFLKNLVNPLIESTHARVPLTAEYAYGLGVCVGASTIEMAANSLASYATTSLWETIRAVPAPRGRGPYTNAEYFMVTWGQALKLAGLETQEAVINMTLTGLKEYVEGLPAHAQAAEAGKLLGTFQRSREVGRELNCWEGGLVVEASTDAEAIAQLTEKSLFARAAHDVLVGEEPFEPGTPTERYAQAVARTLALVGRGVLLFSAQR